MSSDTSSNSPHARARRAPLICSLLALIVSGSAAAQEIAQPAGVGPLPDLQGAAKVGAFLSKAHVHLYQKVLLPEVVDLIKNGEFVAEVALRPKRKDLFTVTKGGSASFVSIDATGALRPPPEAVVGQILADSTGEGAIDESARQAYVALWNAAIHQWRLKSLSVNASLTTFAPTSGDAKRVDFVIQRFYPRAFGVSPGTLVPLFREKISATQPPALKGFSWLTLRFHGNDEDYIWAASPIAGQARQLTGSNRADEFFSGAFSPDDLFVWSGKIEKVKPVSVTSQQLLVQVVESVGKPLSSNGCSGVEYGKGDGIETNLGTRRYQDSPGWIPATTKMVLRNVTRIDLESTDPYSLDARQSLYLDTETSIPVFKTVRAIDGSLRKLVLGVVGTVSEGSGATPGWRGESIFTPPRNGRSLLSVNRIESCSSVVVEKELKNFDPAALATAKKDGEGRTAKAPTPNPAPEEIEPVDE